MSVSAIGNRSQVAVQGLVDMRRQLDELQRQLGTGKRADDYAGLGLDRGLTVGLRAQLSSLDAYDQTIATLGTRLELSQALLGRLDELGRDAKSSAARSQQVQADGRTAAQSDALLQLDEIVDILNSQAGDRYVFGGRAVDRPPVASTQQILDGEGARAGLKQVIAERALADLGVGGLGSLNVAAVGAVVGIAEDATGSPFGFKLIGASTGALGVVITGPADAPPSIGVSFASNPSAGETISVELRLPDGSSKIIRLTATTSSPPAANEFTIGGTPAATAANLGGALNSSLGQLARTSLKAASAAVAANDFFSAPPLRVAGPPYANAAALVAGTAANTVSWYFGESGADPARASAAARIDPTLTVNYGLRANEDGIRLLLQNVATLAATSFSVDADGNAAYSELTARLQSSLAGASGEQRIADIVGDLAHAQTSFASAKERHTQTRGVLSNLLESIEGVPTEQVAAEILALQTRLQASLQTTAQLYRMSLADYL